MELKLKKKKNSLTSDIVPGIVQDQWALCSSYVVSLGEEPDPQESLELSHPKIFENV